MLSRWTDFLTLDGEKKWRERDLEFEDVLKTNEAIFEHWESGWKCLFKALENIDHANFHSIIYIRNQGHTIVEALNRQLAHYAYHIGQIVYIGKMIKESKWESLSIPKGTSEDYNLSQFSQSKKIEHFTDEISQKT